MQAHSGVPLYVLPICWTDLHAQVLGARFVSRDPVLTPVPVSYPGSSPVSGSYLPRPSQTAAALGRELTTLLSPDNRRPFCKSRAIKNAMATLFPDALSRPKTAAELDLNFGGRVFRKAVRVPILWKHPDAADTSFDSAATRPASSFNRIPSGSQRSGVSSGGWSCDSSQSTPSAPMLAYISRSQLAFIRQNLFRIVPGPETGDNQPVLRLQQLRSKQLLPADVDHDAHFVGILLAMAQAHFYGEASSRASSQRSPRSGGGSPVDAPPPPDFHDVKVQLLTHADETAEFIVYTAVVSAAFLRRFSEPAKASQDAGKVDIEYTKVPIWPILGLKERLGKALGRDVVGDVFEDGTGAEMETWESQEERQHRMSTLKRRRIEREALAQVLKGSFEVENDADRDVSSSPHAKRRRPDPAPSLEVC